MVDRNYFIQNLDITLEIRVCVIAQAGLDFAFVSRVAGMTDLSCHLRVLVKTFRGSLGYL